MRDFNREYHENRMKDEWDDMNNWKGDTAASARAISNAQARFRDRQHNKLKHEPKGESMAQDYKERARQREKERKQSVWYKLAEGDNTFRLLPTPAGKAGNPVFFEYSVHRDVGPKKIQVRCGKDIDGEGDCWLCDRKIEALKQAGHDARAAALAARDVFLVQVAKVDEEGNFTGPYLMTPSKTLADGILRLIGSKKRSYEDPKKGFNITVSRTGTGRNDTRYGALEIDEAPSQVPAELIKKLKPFDELKEIPHYSEGAQKAAYQGIDYVEDEEDGEEDTAPRKKPNSKKPAPVADDEGEEEEVETGEDDDLEDLDEEEVEEEEEEEAPPAKKPKAGAVPVKKKKPVPEPDEDVEEEAEEDDEEEEAPPANKKPAAPPAKKKAKPEPEEEEEEASEGDDDDLDDLDDLEDLDDAEEEEEAPAPKKKPAAAPPAKKKVSAEPPPRKRR